MGTVLQISDRSRPALRRIGSEEEALSAARDLSALLHRRRDESCDFHNSILHGVLDELGQTGLLGITIPDEHGGTDICNAALAEVVAAVAEASMTAAEHLRHHFHVLEALRVAGSDEQKSFFLARALSGDRIGGGLAPVDGATNLRLRPADSGPGFVLWGQAPFHLGDVSADWLAVAAADADGDVATLLVPRGTPGLSWHQGWSVDHGGTAVAEFDAVHVQGNTLLRLQMDSRRAAIDMIADIVQAAIDLGTARARLRDAIARLRTSRPLFSAMNGGEPRPHPIAVARIGDLAIRIEAASALLERVGRKIDCAQISPTADNVLTAKLAVAGARALTAALLDDASVPILDTLSGEAPFEVGETGRLQGSVDAGCHAVGSFHLNGAAPF